MIIPIMSVALLAFGLICRKDKNMFYILLVFMMIIMLANTYNNDWDAYEFMYGLINTIDRCSLTDIGYGFLNFIANSCLNLSFFQFRVLFLLVGIIMISRIIISNAPYPTLVLVLYFIAPFFPNDIIQIRNFMAQAILTFFLTKWINSTNRGLIYFILGIGMATMMHASSLYFILFILVSFIKDDKKLYISVGVGSLLVGALPILLGKMPFISAEKISYYLGKTSKNVDVRGLIIILVFLIQLYILYMIREYSRKVENYRFRKWADMVYKMNILCLPACVIMTVWTFNFYRVPRNMLLLNYIVYSLYLKEKREKKYLNFITVILIFIGICWSALNSFSQWSVIWNNNALIAW